MVTSKNLNLQELAECQQLAKKRPYAGPTAVSCIFRGLRVRAVGRKFFRRPVSETHDEFITWNLGHVLGKHFFMSQRDLPADKQHIVIKWGISMGEESKRVFASNGGSGQVVGAPPTGDVQALLTLADDVYRLCLVDQLPDRILNRLRNVGEFQRVRYEIALAASLVRAGFSISWLESSETHAEFTAFLAESGETIIVEAKSRRRAGVLHEPGDSPDLCSLKADVTRLYLEALKKPTADRPFVIGIDVNLPLDLKKVGGSSKWIDDVFKLMDKGPEPTQEKPAKEFLLVLTNFAWHYGGQERAPAHEVYYLFPESASAVPRDKRTFTALIQAFDTYGIRPEGVF